MRILLVTNAELIERELAYLLERGGHENFRLSAGGEQLLSAVEQHARFHAAILSQAALGKGWPRQVRQLRRRAPYLPAIVLLPPGGEQAWRHAFLAGAFEALPLQSSLQVILDALSRAVNYSAGGPLFEPSRSQPTTGTVGPASGVSRE